MSLEAILDEDELLQECKAQNTRLIDYFQRVDVLQRLFGYVTGQIEGEGAGKFKCVFAVFNPFPTITFAKISVHLHRSSLQRDMVNSGNMYE